MSRKTLPKPLTVAELRERPTLSVPEYAATVGVSLAHAYCLVSEGTLPVMRVGQSVRVLSAPLIRALDPDQP